MTGCIESDVFVVVGILGFAVVFGDGSDADDVVVARSIVSVGVIWGKQRSGIDIDVSSSGCMFVLKFSSACKLFSPNFFTVPQNLLDIYLLLLLEMFRLCPSFGDTKDLLHASICPDVIQDLVCDTFTGVSH